MTDNDLFQFLDIFRSVTRVFPMRGEAQELQDIGKSYFKAMRRFSLEQVRQGAEACMQRLKRIPKPAEWIELIPRPSISPEVSELTAFEASEYITARNRKWNGDPCGCKDCRAAGVDHRFIRFVPNFLPDGRDDQGRLGDRMVCRGRWIHGEELRRWYAAKDEFWTIALDYGWEPSVILDPPDTARTKSDFEPL